MIRSRTAGLVNSRNLTSCEEIKTFLSNHFGESKNVPALIQELQRIRQLPSKSAMTVSATRQTYRAKVLAAIYIQNLTGKRRRHKLSLITP